MPSEAANTRSRLEAFRAEGGSSRALAQQLGPGWSHVKLGRVAKDKEQLSPDEVAQLDAALDDPAARKHDRRLDNSRRLEEARDAQNDRDPYWPYAESRRWDEFPRSFFCIANGDTDEAARLRHLVQPRVRAGLVRDVDGAGPRTNWLLGRLRLFRTRRVETQLAIAARLWAQTVALVASYGGSALP